MAHWFVKTCHLQDPTTTDVMVLVSRWFTDKVVCWHYIPAGGIERCLTSGEVTSWARYLSGERPEVLDDDTGPGEPG